MLKYLLGSGTGIPVLQNCGLSIKRQNQFSFSCPKTISVICMEKDNFYKRNGRKMPHLSQERSDVKFKPEEIPGHSVGALMNRL